MRTIIAGSRGLGLPEVREAMAACGWTPSVVISGTARGVDLAGEHWATEKGISIEQFPADWDKYGKVAGYFRNAQMATAAGNNGALVAVWDGKSRGTRHMISIAKDAGLRVFVWQPEQPK